MHRTPIFRFLLLAAVFLCLTMIAGTGLCASRQARSNPPPRTLPAADRRALSSPAATQLLEISLDQAVEAAVDHYPSIAASVLLLRQQGYLVKAARSAWYPQMNFVWENEFESHKSLAVTPGVRVSQKVWDFGRTKGEVRQAEAMVERQSAAAMAEVDNIIQQTAAALIGLHQQQEQLKAAEAWLNKVRELEGLVTYRFGIGLSTEADLKQARTRLEAARSNLISVKTALAQQRERLTALTGLPLEQATALPADQLLVKVDIKDQAFTANPRLILAEAEQRLAEAQRDTAKAAGLPSIELVGSMGRTLRGDNRYTGKREDFYSSVGLNITQNLFDGGAVSSRRQAAETGLAAAGRMLDAVALEIREGVRLLELDITGLKSRMGVLADRSRSIRQTRILYQEQYQLGNRSLLDLLNAEQEYYQAISEELAARHQIWNDLVAFAVATGRGRELFGLEDHLRADQP